MELIFLGTGAGKPSNRRNVSSLVLNLVAEIGEYWLFDCGESTQHQMMAASVSPHRLSKVFITHLHGDHVLGLPGLLTSRSMAPNAPPLEVYGPVGIKEFIDTVMRLTHSYLTYELKVHEIGAGVIYEGAQMSVKALELEHRVLCFGFRVEEAEKPRKLNMKKLKNEGLLKGEILKKLKDAQQVTLEDGRVLDGRCYLEAPVKRRVIAILGDTRPCANSCKLAQNADVLVHEATFGRGFESQALTRGHSTTVEAAQVAQNSHAKLLILTHISQRYSEEHEEKLLQECQEVFSSVKIAHDLERFFVS